MPLPGGYAMMEVLWGVSGGSPARRPSPGAPEKDKRTFQSLVPGEEKKIEKGLNQRH